MLLQSFNHRGMKVRLHVHDAFEESKHPRGKSGENAGQFVKKGTGGTGAAKSEKPEPPPEQTFVSPNIGNLSFSQAQHELNSKRQKALAKVSSQIDRRLGLQQTHAANVIGAWADGAENSLMVSLRGDPQLIRAAVAMKGHLAEQKAVLLFQPDPDGDEHMASFNMKGDLDDIHSKLLDQGLQFHTLEPVDEGATVHIYVSDQDTADAVVKASGGPESNLTFTSGKGEFIGTDKSDGTDEEQRNDAKRVYQEVIDQVAGMGQGRDIREVWRNANDHWRAATAEEVKPTQDAPDFDFPIPLDPDLKSLARNKPYNIIQDIFRIQAERERNRTTRPLFHDDFEEGKHPRSEGGQFTTVGGGGKTTGPIFHHTKADISSLNEFDLSKADPNSVWGPGIYATLNEGKWDAGHLKGGKVLSGYVRGDVIDLTKPLPDEDQERMEKFIGRKFDALPLISLEKRYGSVAAGLKAAGYSAALHQGPGATGTHIVVFDPADIVDQPTKDAFEESAHPRGEGGQFTGIGSENPTYKKHIEEGHKLVVKHGFKPVRGPEDADMHLTQENKNSPDTAGPFTIYTKERGDTRHILRFYTKHDWEENPKPLWNSFKESRKDPGVEGEGHYHEGLKEYLEKYHPTTKDRAKVHVHLHDFEEEKHPRGQPGNKGQFGPGGSGASSPSRETPSKKSEGTHPGHGYSEKARLVNGVIQTSNVNDAVRALYENKKVALEQPRQVSTLVSKLGDIAKRMERLGGKVPNFDLCNVSVEGTNLFCAMGKGIPRIKMPQLPDEKGDEFQKYLKSKGHKTSEGQEAASYLRATQSELVGVKVSGIMKFFRNKKPETDPPLFISKDGYIVDGHHRWAARVGLDAESGMFGNVKLNVVKVDLPILDLLQEAETFTGGKGHKGATAHDMARRILRMFKIRDTRVFLHFHDFEEAKVNRVKGGPEAGEFTSKGGQGGGTKKPRERKRERGFEPAEGGGKEGFTLPGGGALPKHIAALRIPPAWTDVRYNPDPNGALLVAGTDSKNRRQPLYSEKYENSQAAYKFKRSQILEKKFDRILEKNTKCMKARDPRTRDLASVLALIMHTAIRPGGEQDTGADYKSYGATTMEGQHVITDENGDTALRFVSGKHKGKDVTIKITDPEVAQMLKERAKQSGEGKKLFPNADPRRLLAHVKSLAGADFKTKDFRTLIGTRVAAGEINNMPVPKTPAEYKKFAKAVATTVSEKLGNTPTVAMKSYIAPHVFAEWKLASGA